MMYELEIRAISQLLRWILAIIPESEIDVKLEKKHRSDLIGYSNVKSLR